LARWRSEDAADRALLADVGAAARRWNESGRPADLLWRGQALAELTRLTKRSTALTELERAFATDAASAQQRARRIRRGIVAGVMIVLAAAASVMAYLSVVANENRAEAERNATAAKQSAALADERLTASLIAQGRRELNDNRAMPALAYFAAAMKRGADTAGLRAMVSIASRGWKDTLVTSHAAPFSSVTGSPNGWIAAGDQVGTVHYWSDTGVSLGEVKTEVGPIATVERQPDDTLVVIGNTGVVLLGTKHEVLRRVQTEKSWYARFGPGPDELTAVGDGKLRIYGFDGKVRREIALDTTASGVEPVFAPSMSHALVNVGDDIAKLDLVTMRQTIIVKNGWGPPGLSRTLSTYAYVDKDHRVHVIDLDGKPIKTLDVKSRTYGIVFSQDGDRIGVVGDAYMTILDAKGERLGEYPIARDQSLFLLRGDHAWITGNQGIVRHYSDGELVSSIPAFAVEVQASAVARDAVALIGSDASLAIIRANSAQIVEDKEVCDKPAYASNGIATGYECAGHVKLYLGRSYIAEYPVSEMQLAVAYDEASHRSAVSGGAGVHIFDRDAKVIAKTAREGRAAFEDGDHVLVAEAKKALWRWTISTDTWQELMPIGDIYALAVLPGKILLGQQDGKLLVIENGHETHRADVGTQIGDIVASPDKRWLAVSLATGAVAIVDAQSWQVTRMLAAADNYGMAATFDGTGDLLIRSSRNALTIWDRASGEELLFGFDLLQDLSNGRFLPDGRIEIDRRSPGLLDIPRDTRPIAQLVRDIDCKVPLKVVGSRIEPQIPSCP
ncbi:MAG TPA: hypothetical protein VFV99_28500, partial [Kofleriaceae bacterium]|nr:hypothetical protein [Kofleriaceae bacterium]